MSLRACLKSLYSSQAAGHKVNHSDVDHGFAGLRQILVVLTQPPVAVEPAKGPFHNPSVRLHHKAGGGRRPFDNLQADLVPAP